LLAAPKGIKIKLQNSADVNEQNKNQENRLFFCDFTFPKQTTFFPFVILKYILQIGLFLSISRN
jgi:hypothetical protein